MYRYFKLAFELAQQKKTGLSCQNTDRTHWSNGIVERSKYKYKRCMQQSDSNWQRSDPMAYRHVKMTVL